LLSKNKRIVNRKLLDEVKKKPCVICGSSPCDPSHIKTRGSGGGDDEWNVVPMCRWHHFKWGSVGVITFLREHPKFKELLFSMGWEISSGKLFHNGSK